MSDEWYSEVTITLVMECNDFKIDMDPVWTTNHDSAALM